MYKEKELNEFRRKYKFNWFDALAILILVMAVVVIWYLIGMNSANKGENIQVLYSVEFRNIPKYIGTEIESGDTVTDLIRLGKMGVIKEYTREPYYEDVPNTINGTYVSSQTIEFDIVTITVESSATKRDGRIFIGDVEIAYGNKIYFRSAHFVGEGYCVAVEG